MTVWRLERDRENIKIEIERLEKKMIEKQDDFQRATRRGDHAKAHQDRQTQLQLAEKIRLLTRELILVERRLQIALEEEKKNPLCK